MKEENMISGMGIKEILSLTDIVCATSGYNFSGVIGSDLIELVKARVENKDDYVFEVYYDEKGMKYCKQQSGSCYSDEYDNKSCDEPGWNWMRITGPREVTELNYSGMFTYEASNFVNSYLLYSILVRDNIDFRSLLGEDVADRVSDLFLAEENYPDETDIDYEEEEKDRNALASLWLYGAHYIDCKLAGVKMAEADLEKLNTYYDIVLGGMVVDAVSYYDSFFKEVERYGLTEEEQVQILPYVMDVIFALKLDGAFDVTPTLYIYDSKPLKEYSDIRKDYLNSPYISYLDKLRVLLEDPVAVRQFAESEKYYETDVLGMLYADNFSAKFEYLKDSYIAIYYYFDSDEFSLKFNPLFRLARQLFDRLFEEMKKEGVIAA